MHLSKCQEDTRSLHFLCASAMSVYVKKWKGFDCVVMDTVLIFNAIAVTLMILHIIKC